MIGYTTVGTNDLPRAMAFYDELFAVIGIKRIMDFGNGYAWGLEAVGLTDGFALEGLGGAGKAQSASWGRPQRAFATPHAPPRPSNPKGRGDLPRQSSLPVPCGINPTAARAPSLAWQLAPARIHP